MDKIRRLPISVKIIVIIGGVLDYFFSSYGFGFLSVESVDLFLIGWWPIRKIK